MYSIPLTINGFQFSKNLIRRYLVWGLVMVSSLILGESFFALGHAQSLGQRPGQTALQSSTGTAVADVCPQLGMLNNPTALQTDLFEQCRALVQTGNELNGTGPTGASLGLSNEELNSALQQIAVEEVLAPRTMATKTFNGQQRNLNGRLASLRAGARGFSMAGLNLHGLNPQAALNPEPLPFAGLSLQRGGGASGDSGGGGLGGRLGAFISGSFGTGDKDETSREDGFDFDTAGATLGVDYRLLDELVIGTAFTYSHFDADFSTSSVNAGGDSKTNGYVFSLYSTYFIEDFYVEGIGSIGWNDYDFKRKIEFPGTNRTAKGDTDATQYSFTIGTGYNAHIKSFDFGPYARLSYLKLDIDGFKESGAGGLNLEVEGQDVKSLITALGLRASKKYSWDYGVWFPQIRGEWDHEFENDAKTTRTQYVNDPFNTPLFIRNESPDRDFFRLGFTLANVSAGGTQVFFDYETFLGLRDISNHVFTIGARHEY